MINNKLTVVVDTNVIIYALSHSKENSNTKILELIESKKINVIFSQDTFGELIYLLKIWSRKNIPTKNDRLGLLHDFVDLFYNSLSYNTTETICPTCNDKTDDMLLRCATQGNADYLITQDFKSGMHTLKGLNFKVVTSDEFIKLFK